MEENKYYHGAKNKEQEEKLILYSQKSIENENLVAQ